MLNLCVSLCADIEEKGVTMKLTVIDTPGFGDQINNENWSVRRWDPLCLRPLHGFLRSYISSSCSVSLSLVDSTPSHPPTPPPPPPVSLPPLLPYGNASSLCRSSSSSFTCPLFQLAAHHEVHQRPVRGLPAGGDQHQQEEEDPRLQSPLLHILHPAHWTLVRMRLVFKFMFASK